MSKRMLLASCLLPLDGQPDVDLGGNAGFTNQVDNHLWRVATGIALGSVLAAGVMVPQGNMTGFVPTVGQGDGSERRRCSQPGRPADKIRPGFSVNVLVTKDLVLEPYR